VNALAASVQSNGWQVQRYLQSADAKYHSTCMPPYLLFQYGKIGNESQDLAVPYGHSDISVTMNVYTHIGFDDVEEKLKRMEEFRKAQAEIEKKNDAKAVSQKMFKVV